MEIQRLCLFYLIDYLAELLYINNERGFIIMQVLKDEIKDMILKTAGQAFLEYGFEKASMKDIAKFVGVSTGNLYRYFANKEALFDAVTMPAYQSLQVLIQLHEQEERATTEIPVEMNMIDQLAFVLSELLKEHREGLLILLDGSKGTARERAKDELCQLLATHIESHIIPSQHTPIEFGEEKLTFHKGIAKPIAVAFFEGYFKIIRLYADHTQIQNMTKQYIALWFMGLQKLM